MKKLLFSVASVIFAISAMAQDQVAPEQNIEQFATYNRSSVSVVTLDYNDQWDDVFQAIVKGYNLSSKFDYNHIPTTLIALDSVVRTTPKDSTVSPVDGSVYAPVEVPTAVDSTALGKANIMAGMANMMGMLKPVVADIATGDAITEYLNANNVGKEILSYILARDAEGNFSRAIMDERSAWNATDEDVANDQALQVKRFGQDGNTLVKSSYITVYDMKNPTKTVSKYEDGKESITWSAVVSAYVYEMENAEQVVENVLGNMWINEDDDAATKAAKKTAFDTLQVNVKLVAAVAVKVSDKYLDKALATSYEKTLHILEKKIDAWKTTAACETVRPYITAKVGTKEGIKNADRYAIYGQKWNKKIEAPEFKRLGYARATVVADNMQIADGNSDSTYFYQIGGTRLKGDFTEIIKQSNDLKLGISVTGNYNQLKFGPTQGGFSMVNLDIDYLAHMHKNGISHYGLINVGYDVKTEGMFEKANWTKDGQLDGGVNFINFGIGYRIGLKVKQVMEFQPFVKAGIDMAMPTTFATYSAAYKAAGYEKEYLNQSYMYNVWGYDMTKEQAAATYSVFVDPGLRIVINCGYPFQLFLQADYALNVYQGAAYKVFNNALKELNCGHTQGLGLGAGFKINL